MSKWFFCRQFKVKPVSHYKEPSCQLPCPDNISLDEELEFEVEVLRADVVKHLLPEVKTPKADEEVTEDVDEKSEEDKKQENKDPWAFDNKLLTKLVRGMLSAARSSTKRPGVPRMIYIWNSIMGFFQFQLRLEFALVCDLRHAEH